MALTRYLVSNLFYQLGVKIFLMIYYLKLTRFYQKKKKIATKVGERKFTCWFQPIPVKNPLGLRQAFKASFPSINVKIYLLYLRKSLKTISSQSPWQLILHIESLPQMFLSIWQALKQFSNHIHQSYQKYWKNFYETKISFKNSTESGDFLAPFIILF